jgi:NAD(P)H-hydrate epimerase
MRISLNCAQARRIDQIAIERFGLSGLVLMENAGRGAADVLCQLGIGQLGIGGPIAICCGKGNNGGDGFVIARHLALRGHAVRVALFAPPDEVAGDAAVNLRILRLAGQAIETFVETPEPGRLAAFLNGSAWIVDALLGTGARGEPSMLFAAAIEAANACPTPKLAVDLPSGLDCDTGEPARSTIRAAHTCTFVAPKIGFARLAAKAFLGQVHVLDIGAPRQVVDLVLAETLDG